MASTLVLGLAGLVALLLFSAIRKYIAARPLRQVRGPPDAHWLMGHVEKSNMISEVGDLDRVWIKEYGTVYRTKGCFQEDILVVSDPKALQHVYHKSGYGYPKGPVVRQVTREITGEGIVFAHGSDHARNRKIMNPAFAGPQLKSFLHLFQASSAKLASKWREVLQNAENGDVVNVQSWFARTTLDIICEVGFDVQGGALDDALNPVMAAYKNMFADSLLYSSRWTHLSRYFWRWIPLPLLYYTRYIPSREHKRFRETLDIIDAFSKKLIQEKTEAILAGKGENKKDIMSILVRANHAEDPKHRLSDHEMIAQMSTFLLAGHETTASALTWLLWELARNPESQTAIRDEIRAIRARATERGDADFAVADLDAMHYTVAAMKEALRLHPIVYMLSREASRDDVLPLANPITLRSGEVVNEVAVPKGTTLNVSIWSYNRLPQIWGADAEEFNPRRFLDAEKLGKDQTYVGVTSNLMTFSAGLQACIGWRFSIIEMQAILVELIENFEFSIPASNPQIRRLPAGLMAPLVVGDEMKGPQMPLHVKVVR